MAFPSPRFNRVPRRCDVASVANTQTAHELRLHRAPAAATLSRRVVLDSPEGQKPTVFETLRPSAKLPEVHPGDVCQRDGDLLRPCGNSPEGRQVASGNFAARQGGALKGIPPAAALQRDYESVARLGGGCYGEVFTYRERATGRLLACKRVALLPCEREQAVASEIDALRRVQGHPNVVALQGTFCDAEFAYVLMELCDGGTLFSHVQSAGGGLQEDEARCIFGQLTSALKHCHDHGVIHRDVKLDNVLLTGARATYAGSSRSSSIVGTSHSSCSSMEGGGCCCDDERTCRGNCTSSNSSRSTSKFRTSTGGASASTSYGSNTSSSGCDVRSNRLTVRVSDFGLAEVLTTGQTLHGLAGCQLYAAPEVLVGGPYSFPADVWSLGVVLYTMLSGRWPTFHQRGLRRIFDPKASFLHPIWSSVPSAAKSLIRRMLSFEPHERPTMGEVLSDPWITQQQVGGAASSCAWQPATRRGMPLDALEPEQKLEETVGCGRLICPVSQSLSTVEEGCKVTLGRSVRDTESKELKKQKQQEQQQWVLSARGLVQTIALFVLQGRNFLLTSA